MLTIKRKYIWPYLVFTGTISILVVINAFFIQEGIDNNLHFAGTINLSGRQRLLSQRVVSNMLLFQCQNKHLAPNAQQELEYWNNQHVHLRHHQLAEQFKNDTGNQLNKQFSQLNTIQATLYHSLNTALNNKVTPELISNILKLQTDYVVLIDKAVFHLQQEAETNLKNTRFRQILTALFSGLILIIEIFVFIVPYHRKLIAAYKKLSSQKKLIEDQSKEISQQVIYMSKQNEEMEQMHRTNILTLEGINAGIWNWDIETGDENWSPNFYKVLGYQPHELNPTFDTFLNVLLHPDEKEMVEIAIQNHLEQQHPYHLNIRMKNKNGSYKWYETSGKAARDTNGKPTQMAGSIIDIDDKISYQNQLESLNTTKNKLLSIIAHDLRSPIGGLKSVLDMHIDGFINISHQEFEELIKQFRKDLNFLYETLDNVLIWANSQMKGLHSNPQVVELQHVLRKVGAFYQNVYEQKGLTLDIQLNNAHQVFADPEHLFIILRNLVSNAVKFTPSAGKIYLNAFQTDEVVTIDVIDTGIGMHPDDLKKIMARNEHFSNYGTNKEKGTGLGFGLIFDLVAINHGNITINSELGKGSHFSITLPVRPPQQT